MKKLVVALLIVAFPILAQNTKGRISLIFNEEKFDLPITQVIVRKENDLLFSIRAEKNDSLGAQMVSLEFSIKSMTKEVDLSNPNDLRVSLTSQQRDDKFGKRFTFNYGPRDANVEMYYGNERVNWSSPSFQFRFNKIEITQSSNGLTIKGGFTAKYNADSQKSPLKATAEIKEGKFEIVL